MKKETLDLFPDKELVGFAATFSENYKTLPHGTYESDSGKYKIEYVDDMVAPVDMLFNYDAGLLQFHRTELIQDKKLVFAHSVSAENKKASVHHSGEQELVTHKNKPDSIFSTILWFWFEYKMRKDGSNNSTSYVVKAQELLVKYYLNTGRSVEGLVEGFVRIVSVSAVVQKRLQALDDKINEHLNLI